MMRRTLGLLLVSLFISLPLPAARAQQGRAGAQKNSMTTSNRAVGGAAAAAKPASVLEPTQSPLVSFRLLFMTGAASDPQGKEGVASLTAALLAQGGSRALPYDEIVEAMYPMATGFGWQSTRR